MKMNKTHLIVALVMAILGLVAGFFTGKAIYDKRLVESVTRDTLVVFDTIPQYYPKPVEVERVRTVYQWLPIAKIAHDTVGFTQFVNDSVLVEVPITSKHFSGKNYDAYVSGFEVNMDSIFVYNETQLITETITRMKPPNKLSLEVEAGVDYMTHYHDMNSFAFGDLTYRIKDSRFSVGMRGGVVKMPADKAQPFFGGVIKYRVF